MENAVLPKATYCRLPDRTWGLKAQHVAEGDRVWMEKKHAKGHAATVGEVVSRAPNGWVLARVRHSDDPVAARGPQPSRSFGRSAAEVQIKPAGPCCCRCGAVLERQVFDGKGKRIASLLCRRCERESILEEAEQAGYDAREHRERLIDYTFWKAQMKYITDRLIHDVFKPATEVCGENHLPPVVIYAGKRFVRVTFHVFGNPNSVTSANYWFLYAQPVVFNGGVVLGEALTLDLN